MVKFQDGPAAGETLALRRVPKVLRVVCKRERCGRLNNWDALNELEDEPESSESIFVYIRRDDLGVSKYHLLLNPRRLSGWYFNASYSFLAVQPADEIMRDTAKWRTWCDANVDRLSALWPIPEPKD